MDFFFEIGKKVKLDFFYFENNVKKTMQNDGIIVYAVGVGNAIKNELLEIASEPINRHKFSVSDFDAIEEIRSNLRRTICIDSVCPTLQQDNILNAIGYFKAQFKIF